MDYAPKIINMPAIWCSKIEGLLQLKEKERRILQEQDPVVSQSRRRHHLMAGVPKIFDMIRLLFQSVRRSVITKEELIHKIVAGNLDIVDRSKGLLYFHHSKENNSSVLFLPT